ncbi:hypothetical protein NQ317_001763 [Molorchus minor]|uniref:Uncharacterized protein n=1 Tax=Molorchus minor TaxID=1323400 RepID=A0ABQ9JIY5_9CUCU|nr:hypothetical protein NQ317_001763 [Molorchus minor]
MDPLLPQTFTDFRGLLHTSVDFHGHPWTSTNFHGLQALDINYLLGSVFIGENYGVGDICIFKLNHYNGDKNYSAIGLQIKNGAEHNTMTKIVEAANIAISNLLPTKSRSLYDIAYNRFKKWCAEKNVQLHTARMFCWHTSVKMQRITSLPHYGRNILWLKPRGDGYQAKKSKILTKSEIDRFLSSADDREFLMIKVGPGNLGIAGACRTDELVNLTDVGSSLIVKIPNSKTKIPRIFVVTDVGNMLELFRKYLSLRPPHLKH